MDITIKIAFYLYVWSLPWLGQNLTKPFKTFGSNLVEQSTKKRFV